MWNAEQRTRHELSRSVVGGFVSEKAGRGNASGWKLLCACSVALAVTGAFAERAESRLTDWTCEGAKVSVPHTWNSVDGADGQGAYPTDKDNSVGGHGYLRTSKAYATSLPDPKAEKRYFVHCGGAAVHATVAVNGRLVGEHRGPHTAFAFEITKHLRAYGNTLEITVDNYFDENQPPLYGDYTVFGGLYRHVTLIETDPVCLDPLVAGGPGFTVEAEADGTVRAKAFVNGDASAEVSYTVNGQTFSADSFKVADVKPWSPEAPNLYDFTVTVRKGAWSDSVTRKIGFRTAEFRADGFYLNGTKRQMRGVNVHQEREGKGWAITDADITEDLEIVRSMGADAVRGAHYSHSQHFYDECDRLGIMSIIEVPAGSYVKTNELYLSRLKDLVREEIMQCRNHPTVMLWSIYNELYSVWDCHRGLMGPKDGEIVAKEVQAFVKTIDTWHATTCAAAYSDRDDINRICDVLGFNAYPGWYHEGGVSGDKSEDMAKIIDAFLASGQRTIVGIGEYGGGASLAHHANPFVRPEPGDEFHPEENQTDLHMREYGVIKADPRVWGSFVWVMYDFASDCRDEGDRRGINDKGLVTRDRLSKKDAYYFYKANWNPEPMLFLSGKRLVNATAQKVMVRGFSNVGDVTLVLNGKEYGTLKPDAVNTVTWNDVPLADGVNTIELRAGKFTDSCNWKWNADARGAVKIQDK